MVFASRTNPLCTQAVAVATIPAPTQTLPRLPPRREWRAKRATPCQADPWQFLRGGENCCQGARLGTQGVGSISEHHDKKSPKIFFNWCPWTKRQQGLCSNQAGDPSSIRRQRGRSASVVFLQTNHQNTSKKTKKEPLNRTAPSFLRVFQL